MTPRFKASTATASRASFQQELRGIIVFIASIWVCFGLSQVLPLDWLGLRPRELTGLIGVAAMPFLHADLQHLMGNTVPLVVLLALLAGSRAQSAKTVTAIIFLGGALLWLFGRSAIHIGASGLVFGLMCFLLAAGYFERRLLSMAVAVLVGFLYGGTLFGGIIPAQGVSWDGHLLGGFAGCCVAFFSVKRKKGG